MEDINMLGESIKFMFLGMGVVFAFLLILVQVVKVEAKIINKYFPEEVPKAPASSDQAEESQRIAAIIAAVTEFRKK